MQFYKSGEFASRIGVSTVTLYNWERSGKLIPHHRSPTGYRYYSEEQLQNYLNNGLCNEGGYMAYLLYVSVESRARIIHNWLFSDRSVSSIAEQEFGEGYEGYVNSVLKAYKISNNSGEFGLISGSYMDVVTAFVKTHMSGGDVLGYLREFVKV